jgi:NADPH2:quinone reductase
VSRVGPDVDNAWLGRRVAGHTGNEGGYADRALVAADRLCVVPDTLDLAAAAALLHDGPTALRLFDVIAVGGADRLPKRVLWINAAAKQGGDPQVE